MRLRILLLSLIAFVGAAFGQTQIQQLIQTPPAQPSTQIQSPHQLIQTPPAQPPIVLNPLPPQERVDLRQDGKETSRLCTRDVFYPCPDERGRNCTRKETYRCD